jgi:uncharacterized protein (DUF2147 family)
MKTTRAQLLTTVVTVLSGATFSPTPTPTRAQEPDSMGFPDTIPAPDAIVGRWATEPNDDGEYSHVEIYKCDDHYCGWIVWLSHPTYNEAGEWGEVGDTKIDFKNSDEDLRSRPIVGLVLMHAFRVEEENWLDEQKWKDGRIYDPDNGKTYRCELTLADEGQTLKVRGYVRIAFVNVGRTTEWTRVPPAGG